MAYVTPGPSSNLSGERHGTSYPPGKYLRRNTGITVAIQWGFSSKRENSEKDNRPSGAFTDPAQFVSPLTSHRAAHERLEEGNDILKYKETFRRPKAKQIGCFGRLKAPFRRPLPVGSSCTERFRMPIDDVRRVSLAFHERRSLERGWTSYVAFVARKLVYVATGQREEDGFHRAAVMITKADREKPSFQEQREG
ncbi:hypothetical protein KM043_015898 [Ampulex compressa]|nr:hypothetical protein KM043_015898 [Ampulex compressa]